MINRHSQTWITIENWIDEQLTELRSENDNEMLSERETQFIRGRIYQLKELLEFKEE